jgi:hypothetical protein
MPRSLDEYSLGEWLRIRPLVERYKMGRYWARAAWNLRQQAAVGDPDAVAREIKNRHLLITIAFNDPQVICWQADLVRTHVRDCVHLIADNSTDDAAAKQIETQAHAHGLFYLRLAANPWSDAEYSRSHGLAMSWVWQHVIKPGAPDAFGFIDHDLFPMENTQPFAPLQAAPIWGRVVGFGRRWNLWAGFCFFRFDVVTRSDLEFRHDWYAGLDTGGCNWKRLYQHLDRDRIPAVPVRREAALPDRSIDDCFFEKVGPWLHESRFGQVLELGIRKRKVLTRRLAPLLTSVEPASRVE